jgi:predicted phosphodiesterase
MSREQRTGLEDFVAKEALESLPDEEAIRILEQRGYIVQRPAPPKAETVAIDHLARGQRLRLAVVSCTHLGSRYQQLTALREFCAYAAKRAKVDAFVHAGDITDGPVKRHRNPHEVFKHTYDAALDYAAEVLPKGRPWYVISGNHDDWYLEDGGPEFGRALAERREDVTYLGRSLGYLSVGETRVEVVHLNTGSAYAYSYKAQKHIESLSVQRRPHVSLIGNFHKFCALYYRNVLAVQLPSFQAQTPWMAGKSLVSEVGGVILDIGLAPKGLDPVARIEVVWTFEPREEDW